MKYRTSGTPCRESWAGMAGPRMKHMIKPFLFTLRSRLTQALPQVTRCSDGREINSVAYILVLVLVSNKLTGASELLGHSNWGHICQRLRLLFLSPQVHTLTSELLFRISCDNGRYHSVQILCERFEKCGSQPPRQPKYNTACRWYKPNE